jgi:hypothetical protein
VLDQFLMMLPQHWGQPPEIQPVLHRNVKLTP